MVIFRLALALSAFAFLLSVVAFGIACINPGNWEKIKDAETPCKCECEHNFDFLSEDEIE